MEGTLEFSSQPGVIRSNVESTPPSKLDGSQIPVLASPVKPSLTAYTSLFKKIRSKRESPSRFEEYLYKTISSVNELPNYTNTSSRKAKELLPTVNKTDVPITPLRDKPMLRSSYQNKPTHKHSYSIGTFSTMHDTEQNALRESFSTKSLWKTTRKTDTSLSGALSPQKNLGSPTKSKTSSKTSDLRLSMTRSEPSRSDAHEAECVKDTHKKAKFKILPLNFLSPMKNKEDNPEKLSQTARIDIISEDDFVEKHVKLSSRLERPLSTSRKETSSVKHEREFQTEGEKQLFFHLKNIVLKPQTTRSATVTQHRRTNSTRNNNAPPFGFETSRATHTQFPKDFENIFRSTSNMNMGSPKGLNFGLNLNESEDLRRSSSTTRYSFKKDTIDPKRLPSWITKSLEFKEAYAKRAIETKMRVPEVCDKIPFLRRYEERLTVANWIHNVELFKNLPSQIHLELAGRIGVKHYKEEDIICKQGQEGDCLYIIYDGLVDVYVNDTMVATYKTLETVGRQALENAAPRNATLKSRTPTIILTLGRIDYQSIMMRFINQEKEEYISFLRTMPMFRELSEAKLKVLCANLLGKFYYKDDTIYNKDDEALTFYIVKLGKVSLEADIEVEKANKWPLSANQWKVRKITRTVVYRATFQASQWFGEMEIIRGCRRLTKVVASEDAYVLYLNKNKFNEIFDAEDQKKFTQLAESQPILNKELMQNAILGEENTRKQMAKILIDAVNNNMRNKSSTQLEQFQKTKIQPLVSNFKEKLSEHLRKTTIRINRGDGVVSQLSD